jgi:hypothetical protein
VVDLGAVRHGHVGEQHAEVGLVDAERALHGRCGQPDLGAHRAAAGGEPGVDLGALHGVRGLDVAGREKAVPQRGDRFSGGVRLRQVSGSGHERSTQTLVYSE